MELTKSILAILFVSCFHLASGQIRAYQMPATDTSFFFISDSSGWVIVSDTSQDITLEGDYVLIDNTPLTEFRKDTVHGIAVYVKGNRVKVDQAIEVNHIKREYDSWYGWIETVTMSRYLVGRKRQERWNIVKFIGWN